MNVNTNYNTIIQMPHIVNDLVRQATGRDPVRNIDMDFATVAQNKIPHVTEFSGESMIRLNNDGATVISALSVAIEPVQAGSGDPSPENVRSISGWTGVKVRRTGKNLLDIENAEVGVTYASRIYVNGYRNQRVTVSNNTAIMEGRDIDTGAWINLGKLKAGDYTLSLFDGSAVSGFSLRTINQLPTIGTPVDRTPLVDNYVLGTRFTITNEDVYTILVWYTSDVRDAPIVLGKPLLSLYGEYSDNFVPYSGETFDIQFPAAAGTVYGGTLDVIRGVLSVDTAMIASYNGETLPVEWISDRDVYAPGTTPTTGAQVVYKLAEPVIYQLTPQEITLLLGENNIWSDAGTVSATAIKYESFTEVLPV